MWNNLRIELLSPIFSNSCIITFFFAISLSSCNLSGIIRHSQGMSLHIGIFCINQTGKSIDNPGITLCLDFISVFYTNFSASSSITFSVSGFTVERMVTTGSTISISFCFSNIPFIIFAAAGAQEPFSIKATVRFW